MNQFRREVLERRVKRVDEFNRLLVVFIGMLAALMAASWIVGAL